VNQNVGRTYLDGDDVMNELFLQYTTHRMNYLYVCKFLYPHTHTHARTHTHCGVCHVDALSFVVTKRPTMFVQDDGWDTEPFVLTEVNGKLFGRGATDDKVLVVANVSLKCRNSSVLV